TVEQQAGERGQAKGLFIGHREDARKAEANGTHVGVGRRAECVGAAAPHLRFRPKLDVRFQADNSLVIHANILCHKMDSETTKNPRFKLDNLPQQWCSSSVPQIYKLTSSTL